MKHHIESNPLALRALPHVLGWLLLGALGAGCSDAGEAKTGALSSAEAQSRIEAFVVALRPVDATATSDVQDRAFRRATQMREELSRAGRQVGLAALRMFKERPEANLDEQWPLLEVAAMNCPAEVEPLLVALITTYDGERGMGLATQSVRILGESSPKAAIELFEPMLRTPWEHKTKPSQEALVDGWARAAKRLGLKEARVLCDVLVDIRQPADARYAAVNQLPQIGGERAIAALREVLLEASSDGMLRRKAAQALVDVAPRKQACELLLQVSEHESDENFLTFLGSMLDKHCAGL